ncbi:uncharacterized protein THITE_2106375 [Thermothielavioides terrestris NRRL 8126]|uniref:DNA replication factor Cdt1 C-terminal domain-containing protein n=1 Tax=Thermothielavioides terrestris (strain ATCC 38088 / NRRL 8126) TaxID=578455 RepID=G2QXA0_THETT|nr:uncharacterized protein THITE_2106375 [Thermothielavioides terrestris NRRL 8126]AEO62321.1 hypothetical protein THITE_2106375 [Thermothielavioides terrestris NRRL 8126]
MPGVISRNMRTPRGKLASSTSPASPAAVLSSFGKAAKPQSTGKQNSEKVTPFTPRSSNIEVVLSSRKRKARDDTESTPKKARRESEAQSAAPATPVSSRKQKAVSFAEPEDAPRTPSTPSRALATPSTRKRRLESDETSQTEALLERLNLQSSPVHKRSKTTVHRRAPPNDFDLPRELIDLLDLHVAFLKTLNMHYAHAGTTSPIDLRTLYPSVTRAWGKRYVTLDDIQRCVGVLSWTPVKSEADQSKAPYFLSDYGRGKICLEFHADAERGPLREPKLNMDFEANLRTLWLSSDEQPATIFIGTLPKAPIKPCPSLAKSVTNNQTTLDAFKKDIAQRKQQEQEAKSAARATTTALHAQDGSSSANPKPLSLLDRIRLKEQQSASHPSGPSAAEIQRRAALRRAADVAAVIGMLCKATAAAGQARVSFTMAALLARLRDSLRTPVAPDDAAACVRLLAAEVAPGWLRIVTVAGKENVVCAVGLQPSKAQVEERVRVLLG